MGAKRPANKNDSNAPYIRTSKSHLTEHDPFPLVCSHINSIYIFNPCNSDSFTSVRECRHKIRLFNFSQQFAVSSFRQ